mmetsp:Transcript_20201/g.36309  ORF Transcript_20201/g.36309 Transcript_20201/m.36309 type:complete len:201 (+) Transcript_20201:274-876(+)
MSYHPRGELTMMTHTISPSLRWTCTAVVITATAVTAVNRVTRRGGRRGVDVLAIEIHEGVGIQRIDRPYGSHGSMGGPIQLWIQIHARLESGWWWRRLGEGELRRNVGSKQTVVRVPVESKFRIGRERAGRRGRGRGGWEGRVGDATRKRRRSGRIQRSWIQVVRERWLTKESFRVLIPLMQRIQQLVQRLQCRAFLAGC